jgi:hypothetical protein
MDLHPWRLWHASGGPEVGTEELVETLEQGLTASSHPGRALQVAHRLSALPLEPAAAHLVHMPAHIYMRVGDWEAAVESNEHATDHALDYRPLSAQRRKADAAATRARFEAVRRFADVPLSVKDL